MVIERGGDDGSGFSRHVCIIVEPQCAVLVSELILVPEITMVRLRRGESIAIWVSRHRGRHGGPVAGTRVTAWFGLVKMVGNLAGAGLFLAADQEIWIEVVASPSNHASFRRNWFTTSPFAIVGVDHLYTCPLAYPTASLKRSCA